MFSFEKKNAVSNNVCRPESSRSDYDLLRLKHHNDKQDRDLQYAAKSIRDLHALVNALRQDMNQMRLELDEFRDGQDQK